jgi:CheY-like chemotaxis protein
MSEVRSILVAADDSTDVQLVGRLLREEFEGVHLSTNPEHFVQDFERYRPRVLVLAYKSLEDAERSYLGLYRHSRVVHSHMHRTLLLCSKEDVRRAYQCCRKDYFDDYILFWPLTHDATRLAMSVHIALRALAEQQDGRLTAEMATQARRIAELEQALEGQLAQGSEHVEDASLSLQRARVRVGEALDRFSKRILDGTLGDALTVKNADRVQREFQRLDTEEVQVHLHEAGNAMQPVHRWVSALKAGAETRLSAADALAAGARKVRPQLLLVDDDEFMRNLLAGMLSNEPYDLFQTTNAAQALAALRRGRPDLILMDVSLPDLDGVEVTRRLKEVPEYASIPIVMISGQSERQVILDSLKAGAADFVVKPVERDVLVHKLARLLEC